MFAIHTTTVCHPPSPSRASQGVIVLGVIACAVLAACGDTAKSRPETSVVSSSAPSASASTTTSTPASEATAPIAVAPTAPTDHVSQNAAEKQQQPASPAPAASTETAAKDTQKDEVKMMKEYWDGTKIPKFVYEMRRGADGKWDRNGRAQAYYSSGKLEREGRYKDGKRVGLWTYYDPEGKVLRTEQRGGE